MRFLISSCHLKEQLSKIDFSSEIVQDAVLRKDSLTLTTESTTVEIILEPVGLFIVSCPKNVRWDWVKDLVSRVESQPIVLQFHNHHLDVIFQF